MSEHCDFVGKECKHRVMWTATGEYLKIPFDCYYCLVKTSDPKD